MEKAPNWAAQVFLVLLPAAVGCLLGSLILDPSGGIRGFVIACATIGLLFALGGACAPVLGIKKPLRSYRLLAGVGRSPLSRQAALVGSFALLVLIHWILVLAGIYATWFGIVTVAVGAAATLAAGLVYLLGAQPAWRHWSTPVSLFGGALAVGVALALVVALGWQSSWESDSAGLFAARLLALIGCVAIALSILGRSLHLRRGGALTQETWALTQHRHRSEQLGGAVLAVIAAAAAAVSLVWPWAIILAFAAAAAAQFLWWRLFFVTGIQLNWKNEVRWSLAPGLTRKEG